MKKIVVLGTGIMGAYIASNLSKEFDVTVVDYSNEVLANITYKNIS